MDAINSSLDDVIKKGRQEKKQHKQQQTPPAKRSQGINKRPGPIRNSSSSRGSAFRKSPIQGRRDMNSPWKHDLYEQTSSQGVRSSPASIAARLGGTSSNSIKVENLHYEVTEADVNELFKLVGPCKAKLQFDRSGRSIGVANVKFDNVGDAQTAFKKYNNVELDGQPMKISLVESAVAGGDRAQGILGRIGGQSIMSRVGISHNTNQRGRGRRPNRGGQKGDQRRKVRSENDLDKEMDSYMSTPDDSAMTLD